MMVAGLCRPLQELQCHFPPVRGIAESQRARQHHQHRHGALLAQPVGGQAPQAKQSVPPLWQLAACLPLAAGAAADRTRHRAMTGANTRMERTRTSATTVGPSRHPYRQSADTYVARRFRRRWESWLGGFVSGASRTTSLSRFSGSAALGRDARRRAARGPDAHGRHGERCRRWTCRHPSGSAKSASAFSLTSQKRRVGGILAPQPACGRWQRARLDL